MNEARRFALEVVRRLRDAGHQALWAGGCVRDTLLGLEPDDYDVATNARPEEVRRLFRRTIAVGASFGVIEVLGPKVNNEILHVQVATFRVEGDYSDGRRPDRVEFSTAEQDVQRRDFTINGLLYDPLAEQVIDYVDGQSDLKARILRAIGDPRERFREDKLRMLRAVRFAARFDLTIDPATQTAIQEMASQIRVVSAERIAEEFRKMLMYRRRARAVQTLWQLGLVAPLLPELLPMKGLPQGPPEAPTGDLWDHVLAVLDRLDNPSFPLAFATVLHDIGKPRTVGRTPEKYTFYHHEHVGRQMASEICLRFRLSNAERERVEWLVEKHQFLCDAPAMRLSKLKMTLAHPGIRELLDLHRADAEAAGKSTAHVKFCEEQLSKWSPAELQPEPLLTGHDLLALGVEAGPVFKEVLERVYESQLEGKVRTKEEALAMARELLQR